MLYALFIGATLLLLINALFAVAVLYMEINGGMRITPRGDKFIQAAFGLIAVTLLMALMAVTSLIVGGS